MINEYPYSNFNEYNLDWLIRTVKKLQDSMTDYEALHSITFGGIWDISKEYQAWTIVSDPVTNNGYLSLVPVPNNVLLTDTNYWLQISTYTDDLANIEARVDAIDDDITDNIKPDITAIENDITDNIKPDITSLQNDITSINNEIDELKKGHTALICIGDSYGLNDAGWSGWGYEIENDLPDLTVYVTANGGSGFIGDPNERTYKKQLEDLLPSIDDPTEITDILIGGGYNDVSLNYTKAQLILAANDFMEYAKEHFPYAKVHFAFLGVDYNNNSMQQKLLSSALVYFPEICASAGIQYVQNAWAILLNKSLLFYSAGNPNNYFHPNTSGCQEIAKQLITYLFAGYFDVRYGEDFGNVMIYSTNGEIDIIAHGYAWQKSTSASIAFDTWVHQWNLGTDSNLLWGTNDNLTCFSCFCGLTDNSGGFKGNVMVRIYQKYLDIKNVTVPGGMTISGGGYFLDWPSVHIPIQAAF